MSSSLSPIDPNNNNNASSSSQQQQQQHQPRPLQMGAKGAYIVRLLMVGDSSCGKTSLVLRFDQNVFSTKFVTTIGVDYRDKMVKVRYCSYYDVCHLYIYIFVVFVIGFFFFVRPSPSFVRSFVRHRHVDGCINTILLLYSARR